MEREGKLCAQQMQEDHERRVTDLRACMHAEADERVAKLMAEHKALCERLSLGTEEEIKSAEERVKDELARRHAQGVRELELKHEQSVAQMTSDAERTVATHVTEVRRIQDESRASAQRARELERDRAELAAQCARLDADLAALRELLHAKAEELLAARHEATQGMEAITAKHRSQIEELVAG